MLALVFLPRRYPYRADRLHRLSGQKSFAHNNNNDDHDNNNNDDDDDYDDYHPEYDADVAACLDLLGQ